MNSKHKLAISAVYKNETPYLEEWLRYHQSIDVSHIFLYDNDGNEEAKNIIQPYIRENFVTYIDWHLKNCWL
jgi:hypothetical protein